MTAVVGKSFTGTSALNAWNDPNLAIFKQGILKVVPAADPWLNLDDSVSIYRTEALTVTPSADSWNNLVDDISILLDAPNKTVEINDTAENLNDSLAILRMGLLVANLPEDTAANLADLISVLESYFVGLQSDENLWADSSEIFLDTLGEEPQSSHTMGYRTF